MSDLPQVPEGRTLLDKTCVSVFYCDQSCVTARPNLVAIPISRQNVLQFFDRSVRQYAIGLDEKFVALPADVIADYLEFMPRELAPKILDQMVNHQGRHQNSARRNDHLPCCYLCYGVTI